MYERSYGYKYEEPDKYASNADIAKMIRRDIKQAVDEGLLPASWTYSVRSDSLAIDLEVRDCADAWEKCDGIGCHDAWCAARNIPEYAHAAKTHQRLTEDAEAAKMTLQRIHGAYNHDGSEIQTDYFDVRYYGHVTFEDASSADFRKREAERLAAKKAAKETGEIVGKITNYKRDGSRVTHVVVQTDVSKVLACGARSWRGAMISKASDDAEVTCSRCTRFLASREP